MAYAYIASPYSDPSSAVRRVRFQWAEMYAAACLRKYDWVYSPIVHCHSLAIDYDLPKDFAFWEEYNYSMLEKASELRVLQIPGWKESNGIKHEVHFVETILRLPIQYISLETLETLRQTISPA